MSTPDRVAIYARISSDDLDLQRGVRDQVEQGRELAKQRGWTVVGEYVDNDVSAFSGVRRPEYERLMADASAKRFERIVIFQLSRLWRSRTERAAGIDLLKRAQVGVVPTKGQEIDLTTAYGRGLVGIMGEFDTMESDVKAERVQARARQRAAEGHANGAVLYGWRREYEVNGDGKRIGFRDVENAAEADVVREIVDRLLAGDTLSAIRDELNAQRVPPPGAAWRFKRKPRAHDNAEGSAWGRTSVKKLAMRRANVGQRVHHKGRDDEQVSDAKWPGIVDPAKHERVLALLSDPVRKVERPASRQHLLTWGIGECGVCMPDPARPGATKPITGAEYVGSHLRVALRGHATYGTKKRLYCCDGKGCVGRDQEKVDELVRSIVIERMTRPDALDWLTGDDDAAQAASEQIAALEARLAQAADAYADETLTLEQLTRITKTLKPKIEAAKVTRRQSIVSVDPDKLAALAQDKTGAVWDAMPITQKRALLQALAIRVKINRVTRRGPGFDPASVVVMFESDVESAPPLSEQA